MSYISIIKDATFAKIFANWYCQSIIPILSTDEKSKIEKNGKIIAFRKTLYIGYIKLKLIIIGSIPIWNRHILINEDIFNLFSIPSKKTLPKEKIKLCERIQNGLPIISINALNPRLFKVSTGLPK